MAHRSILLACAIFCTASLGGPSRSAENPAAAGSLPSVAAGLSAYRAYASAQAELLARMTRVLAKDIRDGDLQAAQNDYAMAHKYLERIRPVSRLQPDLDKSMDAGAAAYRDRERDPAFSGFHRIEHDLFASQSTKDLSVYADRLYADALRLRENIATQAMPYELLVDGPHQLIEPVSTRTLAEGSEPYAKTDLWDVEASVDGAREIVASIRPQVEARDPLLMARISAAFAQTSERLSQLRDGCGYKTFDQLTAADKASLRQATTALARELSKLKTAPVVD